MRSTLLKLRSPSIRALMGAGAVLVSASLVAIVAIVAVVAIVAPACSGDSGPGAAAGRLREGFPEQATAILGELEASERGEARPPVGGMDGYRLEAVTTRSARPEDPALEALFPRNASLPVGGSPSARRSPCV
jgi:hypothetical protein